MKTKVEIAENVTEDVKLTRRAKDIIKEAIRKTRTDDRNELLVAITDIVLEKYMDKSDEVVDYQLGRMNMKTTSQILKVMDIYFNPKRKRRI